MLAAASLALAACGEDATPPPAAPAALTPADASVYVEATVRPQPAETSAVEGWLARFPGGDELLDRLVDEVDSSLADRHDRGDPFTYADDVEPWLGERIGFFVLGSGEDPPVAGVFPVDDPNAAREVTENQPERRGGRTTAVHIDRGILYFVDGHGQTAVYLDGCLVAGDEAAVRAAIDVGRGGGTSMEANGALAGIRDDSADAEPLALVRLDLGAISLALTPPRQALPAAAPVPRGDPSHLASLTEATSGALGGTVTAALTVEPDALTLESVTRLGAGIGQTALGEEAGDAAKVLGGLPAASVIAAGVPGFGRQAAMGFERGLGAQFGPFTDPRALREGLRQQLGFDPIGLFRSFGDLGFFVGPGGGGVGGAAVLAVERRKPVTRALEAVPLVLSTQRGVRVAPLPPGLPGSPRGIVVHAPGVAEPLVIALAGGRLALAYGVRAAEQALAPVATLAEGSRLDAARAALGSGVEPSVLVDMAGLLRALRGGDRSADSDLAEIEPYLRPFGLIVAGSQVEGTSVKTRLVATPRR
jgi:hypothetical protein